MKYITAIVIVCLAIAVASAQFFGPTFDSTGSYNGFGGDFGGGRSSFGNVRDSRQNRGPVVFPEPPADAPVESSGVVIGASGYGFVPPNRQQSVVPYSFNSISPFSGYFGNFPYY